MKNFLLNFRLTKGKQCGMCGIKLGLMLALILSIFNPSDVFAQEKSVTINMTNISMETLFREIQRQTGHGFVFNYDQMADVPKISVAAENRPLNDLLKEVLGSRFTYKIDGNIIVVTLAPKPQTAKQQSAFSISGVIKDRKGSLLIGASVSVDGSTVGTVTDLEGEFKLNVPKDGTIVVAFVGMKTKLMKLTSDSPLTIIMDEDVQSVENVVITGYQKIDRRQLTSAVTSLKVSDVLYPGAMSIDKMLEGRIPDMVMMTNSGEVGVVPKMRIRGTSTLIGNREPLWVLDGIVMRDPVRIDPNELNDPDFVNRVGNAIAGVNPQDIERIDVLKDASATALYGVKAANGVIVITTKKGKVGRPVVTYSMDASFKTRPRYTDNQINLMNSQERIQFSKDLVANHHKYPSDASMLGYEGLITQFYNKQITEQQFLSGVNKMEAMNTDWFDILMKDAFSTQHTVSISGGSETIQAYSSVGYSVDNDVIKGSDNQRYTATLNLNANFTKKLSLSFGLNGDFSTRTYPQGDINPVDYAYNTSRAIPAFNEDGTDFFYKKNHVANLFYNYNLNNELANSHSTQASTGLSFNTNLNYTITDYLSATALFGYSTSNTELEDYWGDKTYYASTLRYSEFGMAPPTGEESESLMPYGGELKKDYTRDNSYTLRLQVDFNKYFGKDEMHNINASVGYEVSSARYSGFQNTERGYYKDRGKQFSSGIKLDDFPKYKAWMQDNVPMLTDNLSNVLSVFATASYSFKSLFTVNVNTRFDGSNQFGNRSNEKILPVWSASGVYNISNHDWFYNNIVNSLSLKASYGYQGNMLDGQSPTMIIKKLPLDPHYNEYASEVVVYPNPGLNWERTSSFNVGLDFALFQNALIVNSSFYYKHTADAFMHRNIASVNGQTEYVINSGDIYNTGYSIELSASPVVTRDFRWSLSTSFSKIFNTMNTLPGTESVELKDFLNGTVLAKGHPVSSFYSYKFIGLNPINGGPMFDDMEDVSEKLEGKSKYDVYSSVLEYSGNREPSISGGFFTSFRYNDFSLGFNFVYAIGAKTRLFKLYNNSKFEFNPTENINKEFTNRWQKPGDEQFTNVPGLIDGNSPEFIRYSSHWSLSNSDHMPIIANSAWDMYNYGNQRVVSGNYLKCNNISLSYSIPSEKLERIFISGVTVNASVNNVFIISSPELKGQTPMQGGFTEVRLSERPTFALGLTVSF